MLVVSELGSMTEGETVADLKRGVPVTTEKCRVDLEEHACPDVVVATVRPGHDLKDLLCKTHAHDNLTEHVGAKSAIAAPHRTIAYLPG